MSAYGFQEKEVRRIAKAVRAYEAQAGSLSGVGNAAHAPGLQVIVATLGAKSGTAYAWSQVRYSGGSWVAVTDGLTGTTTDRPAIDTSGDTDIDLEGQTVVIARTTLLDGTTKPAWVICGSPAGEEITVVTTVQVDEATKKIQIKTRTIRAVPTGDESAWTDIHTGVECEE